MIQILSPASRRQRVLLARRTRRRIYAAGTLIGGRSDIAARRRILGHTRSGGASALPKSIASPRSFTRRLGLTFLRPRRSISSCPLCRFRLDLANRLFKGKPLTGDLGLTQRRLNAAQLRDQCRSRTLVQCPAAFTGGVGVEASHGSRDEGIIISHSCLAGEPLTQLCF
jgi:hypothetical protein